MGLINRKGDDHGDGIVATAVDMEKPFGDSSSSGMSTRPGQVDDMKDPHTRLHRGLKSRQITMIAIGGAMQVDESASSNTRLTRLLVGQV